VAVERTTRQVLARKSPKGPLSREKKANEGQLPGTFCKSLPILLHPLTSLRPFVLDKNFHPQSDSGWREVSFSGVERRTTELTLRSGPARPRPTDSWSMSSGASGCSLVCPSS
jgi:hypothetical protein